MNTLSTQFLFPPSSGTSVIVNQGQQQTLSFNTPCAWLDHQRNLTPDAVALVDNIAKRLYFDYTN